MQVIEPYIPIPQNNDEDYEFLERVAIMQIDGGLSEKEAWNEALAIYTSGKIRA